MVALWGSATESEDLGVVAEQCPYCERMMPCIVRAVWEVDYVVFARIHAVNKETTCQCPGCGGSFPGKVWCYREVVPVQEAVSLPVADLLARTNPNLAERIELKQQVSALGGDARFAAALEQLDGLRAGNMHAELLKMLLDWARLEEEQRVGLIQRVGECARAWHLARHVAPRFPGRSCLSALLPALVVWSAFLWAPVGHSWPGRIGTVLTGCGAAALASHLLLAPRMRRWVRLVLVPEAQLANVSLPTFLAVVDDLPGTPLSVMHDLWPIKDQVETIRGILAHDGRL
jgi:hypothetical protein